MQSGECFDQRKRVGMWNGRHSCCSHNEKTFYCYIRNNPSKRKCAKSHHKFWAPRCLLLYWRPRQPGAKAEFGNRLHDYECPTWPPGN